MTDSIIINGIAVRDSTIHGQGVFADKLIKSGEIVERCRIFSVNGNDPALKDYYFKGKNSDHCLITSGFGLLYNHSQNPNIGYVIDFEQELAIFTAERDIKQGEELFISYGREYFHSRSLKPKEAFSWRKKLFNSQTFLYARAVIASIGVIGAVQVLTHLK